MVAATIEVILDKMGSGNKKGNRKGSAFLGTPEVLGWVERNLSLQISISLAAKNALRYWLIFLFRFPGIALELVLQAPPLYPVSRNTASCQYITLRSNSKILLCAVVASSTSIYCTY